MSIQRKSKRIKDRKAQKLIAKKRAAEIAAMPPSQRPRHSTAPMDAQMLFHVFGVLGVAGRPRRDSIIVKDGKTS